MLFRKKLRDLMDKLGPEKVAEIYGVHRQLIYTWAGGAPVSMKTAKRLIALWPEIFTWDDFDPSSKTEK